MHAIREKTGHEIRTKRLLTCKVLQKGDQMTFLFVREAARSERLAVTNKTDIIWTPYRRMRPAHKIRLARCIRHAVVTVLQHAFEHVPEVLLLLTQCTQLCE